MTEKRPFVIICAGGHGRVLIEAVHGAGFDVLALTDVDETRHGKKLDGIPIHPDSFIQEQGADKIFLLNGLGNKPRKGDSGLSGRRNLFDEWVDKDFEFPAILAPMAVIAQSSTVTAGVQIMSGCIIQPGVHIGENTIINTQASIDHDCKIGAHCHIAPGVTMCGGVHVGNEVHVGAGATILPGVKIPDGAVVPAGEVLKR